QGFLRRDQELQRRRRIHHHRESPSAGPFGGLPDIAPRFRCWRQARSQHEAHSTNQRPHAEGRLNFLSAHGNKSQNARLRALEDYKNNQIVALVATEVAARGLDIKELPYVVNYELPNVPEDYVHRIGRTARAGST